MNSQFKIKSYHNWNTQRIEAPCTDPVIVMNKRGCLDLDCNPDACWHFDQSLKTGDEGRFDFYTISSILFERKCSHMYNNSGKQLCMILTPDTASDQLHKINGNLDQRSCYEWISRGDHRQTRAVPFHQGLSFTAVLSCWNCTKPGHSPPLSFNFQWNKQATLLFICCMTLWDL